MKTFSSKAQKIGQIGENIACSYLKNRGFSIVERNYTKKWGEIDIIARENGVTHFIEVKSVSCENFGNGEYGWVGIGGIRPEEQLHYKKRSKIVRALRTYETEHGMGEWEFDLLCVYIQFNKKVARVRMFRDVILTER